MFNFFKKNKTKKNFYREKDALILYFKCNKCDEKFISHLRLSYDLLRDYENGGFKIEKEYIGSNCNNKIQLKATFKENLKETSFELINGTVITKEEWKNE
ncbi:MULTISPECIES: hypothetical protein [Oceanotoga]|jgi:hypothetical protein|uniref:Uncharacterized protein n=1 Tax=Oceanotoga teriensis TaxID=515440 RepID=A0AA45C5X4_9BACT|nr:MULTISPECIES: hypothetical protein [Oceanotoga]MDN5341508.1 hypothetical protein [Oceanotoga sp.]MDO7977713.1 hypothetical protein [Oceanotoga teriensis]PWJ90035.1 hypothetical protein C7380_11323 [Oceanotoga teriensis]